MNIRLLLGTPLLRNKTYVVICIFIYTQNIFQGKLQTKSQQVIKTLRGLYISVDSPEHREYLVSAF